MDPPVSVSKMAKTLQRSPSHRDMYQEGFFKTVEEGVLSSPLAQPIADQDLKMLKKIKSGAGDVMIDEEGAIVRNVTFDEEAPLRRSPSVDHHRPAHNPYYNILMNGVIKRDDDEKSHQTSTSTAPILRHSKSTATLPTIQDIEPKPHIMARTTSATLTRQPSAAKTPKQKPVSRATSNISTKSTKSASGPHIVLGKEFYHPKFDMMMAEVAMSPYNVKPETPYDPKDIDFVQEIRYMKYHNADLGEATVKVAEMHNKAVKVDAKKPKGDKFIVDMKSSSPFFAANGKLRAKGTICNATPQADNIDNTRVLYSAGYVNSHKSRFEQMATLFSRGRMKAEAERRKKKHAELPERMREEMRRKFENVLKYRTDYSLGKVTFSTARWKQQKKIRGRHRNKVVPTDFGASSPVPRSDEVEALDKEEKKWVSEMRTGKLVRRGTKEGLFSTKDLVDLSVSSTTTIDRITGQELEHDTDDVTSEDELIDGIAAILKRDRVKLRPASAGVGGISNSQFTMQPSVSTSRPRTAHTFVPPKTGVERGRVTISRFAPTKTWTGKMNL